MIATTHYIGQKRPPSWNDYSVSLEFKCSNCSVRRGLPYRGKETFEFRVVEAAPVRISAGFASLHYKVSRVLLGEKDITDEWVNLSPGQKLTDVKILITDR